MLTFVEKPSRPHHNWVIKVNISTNKHIDIMSPWGDSVVSLLSLPEVYNLIPIMKKSSDSPRLRDIVQNYWWVFFTSVKIQLLGTLLYKWVTVLVFFFRSFMSFWSLKNLPLSIVDWGGFESLTVIRGFSAFTINSLSFCFMYFETLLWDLFSFIIVRS